MEKKYEDTNQNSKEPILKENIKDKITEENHKISSGQYSEEKKIQKYGENAN